MLHDRFQPVKSLKIHFGAYYTINMNCDQVCQRKVRGAGRHCGILIVLFCLWLSCRSFRFPDHYLSVPFLLNFKNQDLCFMIQSENVYILLENDNGTEIKQKSWPHP